MREDPPPKKGVDYCCDGKYSVDYCCDGNVWKFNEKIEKIQQIRQIQKLSQHRAPTANSVFDACIDVGVNWS